MFVTITDKKTGEEIIFKIKSYDIENFIELFDIVDNLREFNFHFEPLSKED